MVMGSPIAQQGSRRILVFQGRLDCLVGPWQVPVADCAVTLLDYVGYDLNVLREEYRNKIAQAGITGDEAVRKAEMRSALARAIED